MIVEAATVAILLFLRIAVGKCWPPILGFHRAVSSSNASYILGFNYILLLGRMSDGPYHCPEIEGGRARGGFLHLVWGLCI